MELHEIFVLGPNLELENKSLAALSGLITGLGGQRVGVVLYSGAKHRTRGSKKPISVLKATANRQSVVITTSVADLSLSLQKRK